jgi:quinol monooxygenase YgiN
VQQIEVNKMAFLLHVEFDASSESVATKMLELLARMGDIVHRDHSEVYTYVFRHDNETKSKLIFTEIYANEEVFFRHASDAEFSQLYRQAFNNKAGKSRKELCIRDDINNPLSAATKNILDNYLHVTYISIQQGFLYRNISGNTEEHLLIVCTGCDENVYEQLNALVSCVTCITFKESDGNRQLIAVVVQIPNEIVSIEDRKPSINTVELVCTQEETIRKFKDLIKNYFQIQSLQIQTKFSGYIHHKSSS